MRRTPLGPSGVSILPGQVRSRRRDPQHDKNAQEIERGEDSGAKTPCHRKPGQIGEASQKEGCHPEAESYPQHGSKLGSRAREGNGVPRKNGLDDYFLMIYKLLFLFHFPRKDSQKFKLRRAV